MTSVAPCAVLLLLLLPCVGETCRKLQVISNLQQNFVDLTRRGVHVRRPVPQFRRRPHDRL